MIKLLADLEKRQKDQEAGANPETLNQNKQLKNSKKARQADARSHPPVSLIL